MARDSILAEHDWDFATKRVALSLLTQTPPSTWLFAYAIPNDAIDIIAILDPSALNDTVTGVAGFSNGGYGSDTSSFGGVGYYTPQRFVSELGTDGSLVIYTNQANAVLRYKVRVTDPTKFSPIFTEALSCLLAAKLAGPIIKGKEGRAATLAWMQQYMYWLGKAKELDANGKMDHPQGQTSWIQGRR
jgi:hypothetical protein